MPFVATNVPSLKASNLVMAPAEVVVDIALAFFSSYTYSLVLETVVLVTTVAFLAVQAVYFVSASYTNGGVRDFNSVGGVRSDDGGVNCSRGRDVRSSSDIGRFLA